MIRICCLLTITTTVFVSGCVSSLHKSTDDLRPNIIRENIEWCDIWISSANNQEKPGVLLVGDSITKGYYNTVEKSLQQEAACARFATSACVADPAFHIQLEAVLNHNHFTVIHFNNGLHGVDYTDDEYRLGYEQALKTIQKKWPCARIVLALTTPLQSGSSRANLNALVDSRNAIVHQLAEKYDAQVNDLHTISKDHPEYYRDPYHYKSEAIRLQSQQVVQVVRDLLAGPIT